MNIVFDLDGTLADTAHRVHYLEQQPKDWDGFFAAAKDDPPIKATCEVYRRLRYTMGSSRIEIWTARPERYRTDTERWLGDHGLGLPYNNGLRMRPEGDYRHDTVVKGEWLAESPWRPDAVFEDRTRMVEFWRSQGITCYQVASGDF